MFGYFKGGLKMKNVYIDGVEYVPKVEPIESQHRRNLLFIQKNRLKKGDILALTGFTTKPVFVIITDIHPLYGWITGSYLKDNMGLTCPVKIDDIKEIYSKNTECLR
jgi:hypothetical protein